LIATNEDGSGTLTKNNYITVEYPAPTITSISPGTITRGQTGVTIQIAGTGFREGIAVHLVDGSDTEIPGYNITLVSASELSCSIDTVDVPLGIYSVVVQNSDEKTATKINAITIVRPSPVAAFSASPITGQAPLTVVFSDLSTNPVSWVWNFGDGGSSTEQNPTHIFQNPGSYSVSLTVTNETGSDTETKAEQVTSPIPQDVGIALMFLGELIPNTPGLAVYQTTEGCTIKVEKFII
jgi:PKD repeat protein